MPTPDELLTEQFYRWEKRGRGWHLYPGPVAIEPPFRPFYGHYLTAAPHVPDDGRRQTFLGALFERLRGESSQPAGNDAGVDEFADEPSAEPFEYGVNLVELAVSLPLETKVTRERAMQTITRLGNARDTVAFELVGLPESVSLQFACAETDVTSVRHQIPAFFAEATVRERTGFLSREWAKSGPATAMVDFGLSREFMLPVRAVKDFDVDPLVPLIAALAAARPGELTLFQVLFTATRHPWADSIMRAVGDGAGHAFFADAPELLPRHIRNLALLPEFDGLHHRGEVPLHVVDTGGDRADQVEVLRVLGEQRFEVPVERHVVADEHAIAHGEGEPHRLVMRVAEADCESAPGERLIEFHEPEHPVAVLRDGVFILMDGDMAESQRLDDGIHHLDMRDDFVGYGSDRGWHERQLVPVDSFGVNVCDERAV